MKRVNNLSAEWLRLAKEALVTPNRQVSPAVATVIIESSADLAPDLFRNDVDQLLDDCRYDSTETVATTIFPYSLWNPRAPRSQLFDRYFAMSPIIRKRNPRGVYFERLMSYPGLKGRRGFNQLDRLITTYKQNNHRRSALQATLLDPVKDLNSDARVQGFPCLQQVGFLPDHKTGKLTVVAYYPIQYLVRRAYGNYLGLLRLGQFVAHELEFECNKLVCIAGAAVIEKHSRQIRELAAKYESCDEI
jgi:hypothetical protein